jgi:hypothetical protein
MNIRPQRSQSIEVLGRASARLGEKGRDGVSRCQRSQSAYLTQRFPEIERYLCGLRDRMCKNLRFRLFGR